MVDNGLSMEQLQYIINGDDDKDLTPEEGFQKSFYRIQIQYQDPDIDGE